MRSSKPVAIIYYRNGSETIAKDLAASVRAQNKESRLASAGLFDGKLENVSVAIVQDSAGRKILNAYALGAPHVELYTFNEEGSIEPYVVADEESSAEPKLVEPITASDSDGGIAISREPAPTIEDAQDNAEPAQEDTGAPVAEAAAEEAPAAADNAEAVAEGAGEAPGDAEQDSASS